jgi:hypothetical protein
MDKNDKKDKKDKKDMTPDELMQEFVSSVQFQGKAKDGDTEADTKDADSDEED